jgi:hypothetical protein
LARGGKKRQTQSNSKKFQKPGNKMAGSDVSSIAFP